MTVSDLIYLQQQQDPRAIVMVVDPGAPHLVAKLGAGEVWPIRMLATDEMDMVWLTVAEKSALSGLLLGSLQ